jgi:hypothetical protein
MTRFARSLSLVALALAACTTPAAPPTDAASVDAAMAVDAGPIMPHWMNGPDYPNPIAFGAAMILQASDGFAYLYAIGGSSGSFSTLAPFHAEIYRAQIQGDNSLGAWQLAGHINTGHMDFPLAGHGVIRVFSDDTPPVVGMAVAGGGGPSGTLPQVLAGYVQSTDGSIGMWGSFAPQISAAQGGHVFGTFDAFEPHQLALVGGLVSDVASTHVLVAATAAGTSIPTWAEGPGLPTARYGHGSAAVTMGTMPADIFLVGGAGDGTTGPLNDVLVTARNASGSVTGWITVGTLTESVVFPQVAVVGSHVYLLGGIAGDPVLDDPTPRVRMATASHGTSGGAITSFSDVAGGAMPMGRAGGLVASIGPWVYIVGGIMPGGMAGSSVVYARLEQ